MSIDNFLLPRDPDEVDEKVLSLCDKVSKHFFGGEVKPKKEDIFGGYGDIVGDVIFNAIGSITARNIAKKARLLFHLLPNPRTYFHVHLIEGATRNFPNSYTVTGNPSHVSVVALDRDL